MTGIKNWLSGIIVVCAGLSLCHAMLPKGKFRTILRFCGGMVLIITVIEPLIKVDWSGILRKYEDWEWKMEAKTETYREEQQTELEALIAEKTVAYIEKKAASLGVVCHAQVKCTEREGVPFPTEIVLDIPYYAELSEQIYHDLDITKERQFWQEVEK